MGWPFTIIGSADPLVFYGKPEAWLPLADYVCEIAPDIAARLVSPLVTAEISERIKTNSESVRGLWQCKDGAALDAESAIELATRLQAEIDAGRTATYARKFMSCKAAIAKVPCNHCNGSGRDDRTQRPCGPCHGEGYVLPVDTNDIFSVSYVQLFVSFLRLCGGFSVSGL